MGKKKISLWMEYFVIKFYQIELVKYCEEYQVNDWGDVVLEICYFELVMVSDFEFLVKLIFGEEEKFCDQEIYYF